MNKVCFITSILLCAAGSGTASAAGPQERAVPVIAAAPGHNATQDSFDIDLVVETTAKAMAAAARNYYLPDKPENSRAIARYAKDSRKMIFMNTSFKRELAQVCVDLSNAAANAVNPDAGMLPGVPLAPDPDPSSSDVGLSSITVTEGEMMTVYTNTMPCINAAGMTLHDATLAQYPETAANSSAKDAYGRQLASILTSNRLFNHVLSEVCAGLVGAAKKVSESEPVKK